MNEERQPWKQMEQEPDLWYGRFCIYLRLGAKRSVAAVFQKTEGNRGKPRTEASGHWYESAKQWSWESRARAYDECQRAEEDRIIAAERDKVLRSGFAQMHKRVKELDRLSRQLIKMTRDEKKIWIPEIRTIVVGENRSQTVEKVVFNYQLFQLIDKYFDGIASELGERVKSTKTEHSGSINGIGVYLPQKDVKGGDADVSSD